MFRGALGLLGKRIFFAIIVIAILSYVFGTQVWADVGNALHGIIAGVQSLLKHA
jgi:hypothetical protein